MNQYRFRTKPDISLVAAIACAVFGAFIALFFLPEGGILYSHDSLAYLHAADTVAAGEGYVYFGYSTPMIQWALLMPTFYSFLGLFTADVAGVMVYLNLVFLCVTLIFANLTARRVIRTGVFAVSAQVVMSFSWTLWYIHFHLWSEALFLMFLSMLTYFLIRWLQKDRRAVLVGAGISAALMLLTRFTGMELAGLAGLFVFFRRGHTWKKRFVNALIYGLIGATPYCALLLRNFVLSGTFTGRSKPALYTFRTNLKNTVYRILDWFAPSVSGKWAYLLLLVLFLLAVIALVLFVIRRRRMEQKESLAVPLFLFLHCVLYIVTSLYANSTYALDGVTGRIISPILFCGVILFFWLLSEAGAHEKAWLRGGLIACSLLLAVFSLWRNTAHLVRHGPTLTTYFSGLSLELDPAAQYLAGLDSGQVKIWSNQLEALYYLTGMDVNYIPRRESIELYSWDACVQRWQDSGKQLLVCWYDVSTNPILYQIDELQEMLSLTLVADFGTSHIYTAVLP